MRWHNRWLTGPPTMHHAGDRPYWEFGSVTYRPVELHDLVAHLAAEVINHPPLTVVWQTAPLAVTTAPVAVAAASEPAEPHIGFSEIPGPESIGSGPDRRPLQAMVRCGRYTVARLSVPVRGPGRFEVLDDHPYRFLPTILGDRWVNSIGRYGLFNRSEYAAPRRPWAVGLATLALICYLGGLLRIGGPSWIWVWFVGLGVGVFLPLAYSSKFGKDWQRTNIWTDSEQDSIKIAA
ncbi:hypothetical protein D1871_01755 [Nakamurella silvestris]|nr:hypothetical protein D1871_01755 [Nakamurella silvestris]